MFVTIYEPETDVILIQRKLGDDEIMDERKFADEIAAQYDREIDDSDGYIPNCSGDIRVEFHENKDNRTIIWSGESFYFKREDY